MLNLSAEELKIVRHWSENAETSPFPQETLLVNRLRQNPSYHGMFFNRKELEIVLHWADEETRGHYGTERYLLEEENKLLNKIEDFLNKENE
jgi:hypothetical protein